MLQSKQFNKNVNKKITRDNFTGNERIWIDYDENNRWTVIENKNSTQKHTKYPNPTVNGKLGTDTRQFGTNISVSGDNTIIIAGANNTTDIGRIDVLFRPGENINRFNPIIDCPVNIMGNEHCLV